MTTTQAALVFVERGAQHAEILRQGFPDAGVTPRAAGNHLATAIEIIGVRQKTAQGFADHVLRFGVAEIHVKCLSIVALLAVVLPSRVREGPGEGESRLSRK